MRLLALGAALKGIELKIRPHFSSVAEPNVKRYNAAITSSRGAEAKMTCMMRGEAAAVHLYKVLRKCSIVEEVSCLLRPITTVPSAGGGPWQRPYATRDVREDRRGKRGGRCVMSRDTCLN